MITPEYPGLDAKRVKVMVDEVIGKSGSERTGLSQTLQKQGWFVVSVWLLILVFITSYLSSWVRSIELNIYLFQPMLWLSLGFFVFWLWRGEAGKIELLPDRLLVGIAILVGVFQVSVLILAGVIVGFGRSPYGHQIHLLVLNTWFFITRLIGIESARWYLISRLKRRSLFFAVSFTWLILFLAGLPFTRLWTTSLSGAESGFRLVGNVILPVASNNILATYLALSGGIFASLSYQGVLALFEWFSPILPDLGWTLNAFLGTVIPILGLLFYREALDWRAVREGEQETKEGIWGTGWVLVSVVLVFVLWFNSGLFGVRPTLISGISMEPVIKPGDIVITRDVTANDVNVDDIVLFNDGRVSILHRVVEIREDGGQTVFVTKGDNVNILDEPWRENQLKGKLVIVIPKLGWISIGIKVLISRLF